MKSTSWIIVPSRARRGKAERRAAALRPRPTALRPRPTTYFVASRCFLMKVQSFFVISAGPIGFPPMIDSSDSVRPPNFTAYPPKFFLPAIHHLRRGFARISAALQSHSWSPKTKFYVRSARVGPAHHHPIDHVRSGVRVAITIGMAFLERRPLDGVPRAAFARAPCAWLGVTPPPPRASEGENVRTGAAAPPGAGPPPRRTRQGGGGGGGRAPAGAARPRLPSCGASPAARTPPAT